MTMLSVQSTLNQPIKDQIVEWYLNGQLIVPNDQIQYHTGRTTINSYY